MGCKLLASHPSGCNKQLSFAAAQVGLLPSARLASENNAVEEIPLSANAIVKVHGILRLRSAPPHSAQDDNRLESVWQVAHPTGKSGERETRGKRVAHTMWGQDAPRSKDSQTSRGRVASIRAKAWVPRKWLTHTLPGRLSKCNSVPFITWYKVR